MSIWALPMDIQTHCRAWVAIVCTWTFLLCVVIITMSFYFFWRMVWWQLVMRKLDDFSSTLLCRCCFVLALLENEIAGSNNRFGLTMILLIEIFLFIASLDSLHYKNLKDVLLFPVRYTLWCTYYYW